MMIVERDRQGVSLMPVHNFHEGDDPYRETEGGRLRKSGASGRGDDREFKLLVRSPEAFSLLRGNAVLRFRFVGKADRWVSNAIMVGTYRDATGAHYTFGEDGKVALPGTKPFDFTLGIDHVLTSHDYIYSSELDKSWAASITRENVSLSDVNGEMDEHVSAVPRWSLTRLTPPLCH